MHQPKEGDPLLDEGTVAPPRQNGLREDGLCCGRGARLKRIRLARRGHGRVAVWHRDTRDTLSISHARESEQVTPSTNQR